MRTITIGWIALALGFGCASGTQKDIQEMRSFWDEYRYHEREGDRAFFAGRFDDAANHYQQVFDLYQDPYAQGRDHRGELASRQLHPMRFADASGSELNVDEEQRNRLMQELASSLYRAGRYRECIAHTTRLIENRCLEEEWNDRSPWMTAAGTLALSTAALHQQRWEQNLANGRPASVGWEGDHRALRERLDLVLGRTGYGKELLDDDSLERSGTEGWLARCRKLDEQLF